MSEEISMTEAAEGEFHLTPSAQAILAYLEERGGEPDLLDIPSGFRVRHSPLSSLCVIAS